MEILNELVGLMERSEVKHFKVFASRAGVLENRKDIRLFDYIRKSAGSYNEEMAHSMLYTGEDKNAFYRLKNRLTEDITKSIFLQQYRENQTVMCFYLLSVSYYFTGKRKYKTAFHFFRKAEKAALKLENYSLLDIVYSQLIKASREIASHDTELYIKKRAVNREKMNKMSELEDILEALEYRIKTNQNYVRTDAALQDILEKTIADYSRNEELKNSPKLRFDSYFVISRILLANNNFIALEQYVSRTLEEFKEKKLFNKENHNYKLQMISWAANAAFKSGHYSESLEYAAQLKEEMERYNRLLYDKYLFFYYNSLIINYSETNLGKAISILEELTGNEIEKLPYYGLFIYLNLTLCYYRQQDYKKAIKALSKLYMHEGYKSTDEALKLKAAIGELIIRYELGDKEVLDYRLKQVSKQFKDTLDAKQMIKEQLFLSFFTMLVQRGQGRKDKNITAKIKSYLAAYAGQFDKEEMLFRYDAWLAAKAGLS
ncbi:MAG: hypothetical protein M3Q97_06700 [Bacteroidota bacterium]|nr:hypothetical protein [Bacteroidota bacterium]